jgi:hypothetical protein
MASPRFLKMVENHLHFMQPRSEHWSSKSCVARHNWSASSCLIL